MNNGVVVPPLLARVEESDADQHDSRVPALRSNRGSGGSKQFLFLQRRTPM